MNINNGLRMLAIKASVTSLTGRSTGTSLLRSAAR